MYFLIKFARREFQERLDKYIKGISGTLANITYRQAEVEFPQILFHIQWQFDSIPRRGQAMHVQQQHVHDNLKKDAGHFFIRFRKVAVVYFMQKRGENWEKNS